MDLSTGQEDRRSVPGTKLPRQFRARHKIDSHRRPHDSRMRQGHGGLGPKDGSGSGPRSGLTAKPCRPSPEWVLLVGFDLSVSPPLLQRVDVKAEDKVEQCEPESGKVGEMRDTAAGAENLIIDFQDRIGHH